MGKISDIRRKLQNTLRRKYNYRTNTNFNRGTILTKQDSTHNLYELNSGHFILIDTKGIEYYPIVDFTVAIPNNPMYKDRQITFIITSFKDYGDTKVSGERFIKDSEHSVSISLEEFDLLHAIAHQMKEENSDLWKSSEKRRSY